MAQTVCTRNRHGHLVEVTPRRRSGPPAAKFSGEDRPELQYPSPHRFVGDIQAALSEQIFDVAVAEGETHVKPNCVPDDHRRKLVAGKRNRHPPSYPANREALPLP
jgi:hypothetical protein